jgi:outer membrane protein TolC
MAQGPPEHRHWYDDWPGDAYRAKHMAPLQLQNSGRIGSLMRGGQLYLSLQDAVALALENNLDIEVQRYGPGIADSDVLRTKAGGLPRGLEFLVNEAPIGLGGPASPLLNAATTSGVLSTGAVQANVSDLAATIKAQTNYNFGNYGVLSNGTEVPVFDPFALAQINASHTTTPQANSVLTGSNDLVTRSILQNYTFQQSFSPGTQFSFNFNTNGQRVNSVGNTFNPYTTSAMGFTVTQPLLRGFGRALNRRYIRIARNEQKISDLMFRQQAISTVSGVIKLYWDLVALEQDVEVKESTLALAEKLYSDNQKQVQKGTLAPIEVVRAQAQVAAARQDLINSQAFAREQELILKNSLTKNGTAEPLIREAHIVTTTPIPEPSARPVQPIQDLVQEAFRNRPDLAAAGFQVSNAEIGLEGSRNAVKPELDLVATATNNGLAGSANPLNPSALLPGGASSALLGGIGTSLEQIFRRNYPTYAIGLQLTLPVRNRLAQADLAHDELQYRQYQVLRQQVENQARLEVEDSLIALDRSRASYEAAVQTRILQEESLTSEQKRYAVGISTTFLVIQYQSYLAQARSTEVAAKDAYAKALVNLQRSLGLTLQESGVSIDEMYHGKVSRPSSPLP